MSNTTPNPSEQVQIKFEPVDHPEEELRPTDLSMGQHFRLSSDFE